VKRLANSRKNSRKKRFIFLDGGSLRTHQHVAIYPYSTKRSIQNSWIFLRWWVMWKKERRYPAGKLILYCLTWHGTGRPSKHQGHSYSRPIACQRGELLADGHRRTMSMYFLGNKQRRNNISYNEHCPRCFGNHFFPSSTPRCAVCRWITERGVAYCDWPDPPVVHNCHLRSYWTARE
jgi:hypothetical protein